MYMYNDYTYSLMSDGPCISSLQNPPMTPTSVTVTTCRYLINFLFEMEKNLKCITNMKQTFPSTIQHLGQSPTH